MISKRVLFTVADGGLEPPSLSDWVMRPARYQLLTIRDIEDLFDFNQGLNLQNLESFSRDNF